MLGKVLFPELILKPVTNFMLKILNKMKVTFIILNKLQMSLALFN